MTVAGDLDPFDLPDWLGEAEVVWEPVNGISAGHLVRGLLSDGTGRSVPCDLMAVDEAFPAPVAGDDLRTRVHQAWRHGQVLLLTYDDRPTLAVPGHDFSADRVLEALARLANAVGAAPTRYAALLRLGGR